MDRTERFYKIDQILNARRIASFAELQQACEVSRATLQRDLEYMRSRLNAPIVYDREAGGYRFDTVGASIGSQYELPGLWFSSQEIHALLTMQHLLANIDQGGLLAPHIDPLLARLNAVLGSGDNPADEIRKRVQVVGVGKREMKLAHFERVGSALLRRKRLLITYFARGTGETTEREVSPQRLVHYRENWYLDAWCHVRNGLRNFAIDSIRTVELVEKKAKEVSYQTVNSVLGAGYGIFSGEKIYSALLRFNAQRARWVSNEQWHPDQRSEYSADGQYLLSVPYSDHRELIMDILKFGADCEVLEPAELRQAVETELKQALANYTGRTGPDVQLQSAG